MIALSLFVCVCFCHICSLVTVLLHLEDLFYRPMDNCARNACSFVPTSIQLLANEQTFSLDSVVMVLGDFYNNMYFYIFLKVTNNSATYKKQYPCVNVTLFMYLKKHYFDLRLLRILNLINQFVSQCLST